MIINTGAVDRSVLIFIPDPASTDGSGMTGLAHTAMTISYTRVETDNDVTITDATGSLNALSALTDAHNDWGWFEVSSSLAPGLYRLDLADTVCAAGAWEVVLYAMITTSAAAASPLRIELGAGVQIADALLDRDMALGPDTGVASGAGSRTPRQALRMSRNKWSVLAGTLTVTKENDTTTSWTSTVTGTAGADPITSVDPN